MDKKHLFIMLKNRFNNVLIIDNFDSFTYLISDYLKSLGCNTLIVRNDILPSETIFDFDLLVLSPGPSSPKESNYLINYIDVYHLSKPILGMCLGYQAILEYFGAKLEQIEPVHGQSELIYHDKKTIYHGMTSPIKVGRYHSLAVKTIPLEFEVSGRTKSDIVMSVRHKTLPIEGIQFHPESVLSFYKQNDKRIFSNIVFKYFSNCF